MASQVIIMNMIFNENDVPDFGSIYAVKLQGGVNFKGRNDYGLNEEDVSKLNSITNASPGSTALCDDTGNLYRLTKSGWVLFGGSNSSSSNSTASLNLSPLDLTDKTSFDTTEQDEPETLENDLFTKPDDLTVEPIKGGEELI